MALLFIDKVVKTVMNLTEKEFRLLADLIKEKSGINLSKEKIPLVVARLQKVVTQMNFSSFSKYYNYILADKTGQAVTTLIDRISTNHTFFMREVNHFYYFRDKVIPYLLESSKEKDLRIWSAGCATGEEPYTLAMLFADYFGSDKKGWDTKILATDISSRALEIARKGVYTNDNITSLPLGWRIGYFEKVDKEKSILTEKIRNEVIYRKINLVNDGFSFKRKFHAIFCRNVMIYFDNKTKMELENKFYDLTESGGFLFIGHSECLNPAETRYKYIMPSVYRKE